MRGFAGFWPSPRLVSPLPCLILRHGVPVAVPEAEESLERVLAAGGYCQREQASSMMWRQDIVVENGGC